MPKRYANSCQFSKVKPAERIENRVFESTAFDNCVAGMGTVSEDAAHLVACEFRSCEFSHCEALGAALADCTFEDVDAPNRAPLSISCTTFQRVRFRGTINNVHTLLVAPLFQTQPDQLRAWTERIAGFYASQSDWALDISEAVLGDISLKGIPGDRVIRRVGRDGLLNREQARALVRAKQPTDAVFGPLLRTARELLEGPFPTAVVPGTDSKKELLRKIHAVEAWSAAGYVTL